MKRLALTAAVLMALGVAGCRKDNAGSGSTAANTAAPSTSAIAAGSEEIPTEPDFEDEARQKINDQNMDEELDKLEREIGK